MKPPSERGAAFSLSGRGFHTGRLNRLQLQLAEGDSGWLRCGGRCLAIWGPGSQPVAWGRCTTSYGVGPLEHLSAAALAHGARGWILDAEYPDLPLFDGSGRVWSEAFRSLNPREAPLPSSAPWEGGRWVSPQGGCVEAFASDRFRMRVEWTCGPHGPEVWEGDDLAAVLDARTFVAVEDWIAARRLGYLQGTGPESGRLLAHNPDSEALALALELGVDPLQSVWTGGSARLPNECAAHKAMDLAGDIGCWIGYLPPLFVLARDAGHELHHQLGSALRRSCNFS